MGGGPGTDRVKFLLWFRTGRFDYAHIAMYIGNAGRNQARAQPRHKCVLRREVAFRQRTACAGASGRGVTLGTVDVRCLFRYYVLADVVPDWQMV